MKIEHPATQPILFTAKADTAPWRLASSARPFSEVLAQARQAPATRTVVSGDTMVAIVREQAAQRGVNLSASEALRQAHQVARDSGISDPGRIFPGQKLALEGLHSRLATLAGPETATASATRSQAPAAQVLARASSAAPVVAAPARQAAAAYGAPAPRELEAGRSAGVRPVAARPFLAGPHAVLEQTLDRAVARGFIPAIERGDVYDKILQLASRHQFRPDDFARLTLMESDGMNPRASNERCHGIIQFCDGNDRGAATAGYAANPKAILGFSVYQQLHLVDKYFSEVGVKSPGAPAGPASLDDLYLAVLMPSARGSQEAHAPLGVPGTQAKYLHVGGDRSAPITRQSILDGLRQNASERLAAFGQRLRPQAMNDELLQGPLGGTRVR
jgi:hypothetical protein